jgi:hypothetical protein
MTVPEVVAQMKSIFNSRLEELGVEGFVMAAYITDEHGRRTRAVIVNTNNDAAVQDGLQRLAMAAYVWGQPNQPPIPGTHDGPPEPAAEPPGGGG